MRPFKDWLLGFLLAALALAAGTQAFSAPNIIFILTDDLGYGDVGAFFQNQRKTNNVRSEPWLLTPQLDTLAVQGTQLRRHYCAASVCAPSRASLLMGVHQGHANVRDNQFDKALENNHTLATVLKQAGYATATIGKWGLQGSGGTPAAWPAYPTKRGFDYYFGYVRHGDGHEHYPKEGLYRETKECYDGTNNITPSLDKCYTTDLFTARAKKWIIDHRAAHSAQPFFLYLAYDTPHAVLELPTQVYPSGGGTNGGLQWLGTPGQMINTASGSIDSFYHPDYASATYDNGTSTNAPWPDVYKRYATSVRRIDDCIGDLLQLLKDLNVDTNTLVVFSSDNGPSKESYLPENYEPTFFDSYGPSDGIKRDIWEGGIRVGALARWPGKVLAGQVNYTASAHWDWLPTFAELAGVPVPARSDGVSLLPTLTGIGSQKPSMLYFEYYEGGSTPSYAEFAPAHRGRSRNQMQAIHQGSYKGIRYNVTAATNNFEIYDTLTDPKETNNLALNPGFAALQQQLQSRVLQVRRPDASASRPYDSAYVPASTNTAFTNGVMHFAAFEGAWPWVPEFSTLTAISTGSAAGLDLSVRSRDTNFGIAFSGYLTVPGDADYTFYLTSDSGAHFRIHEATVIDDDFLHSGSEISATIRLKAGRHPFRLYYRHGSGARLLELKYSAPGLLKQVVPTISFSLAGIADTRPQALNDHVDTGQNSTVLIPVLANDTDDGAPEPLSIVSVTPPAAGTATTVGNQIRYTPHTNFLGEDSFSYTISDGTNTASASVTVTVVFSDNTVWLPLNQTSGLETMEAGGGIVGTLYGFSTEIEQWVPGKWGRALEFTGSEWVTVGSGYVPPAGTSARTTAAWIRTTNVGAIIAWGPNNTSRKWHMRLESGSQNTGALRVEIGGGFVKGTKDLRDGQWHHVAGVLPALAAPNATNILLYVDGAPEPAGSVTASPINTDSASATIGVDSQDRNFTGVIDEVRIYNRALSGAEIGQLYAATNQCAAAWHRRFFGNSAFQWYADDDADRGVRLLEYALGSQPHIADPPRLSLDAEIVNAHLQVKFPRRLAGTHELAYTVQASSDLEQWNTLTTSEIAVEPSDLAGFERAVYQADKAVFEQSPLFLRLKIGWQ
jgi:arylsulfatase A-like enzyme